MRNLDRFPKGRFEPTIVRDASWTDEEWLLLRDWGSLWRALHDGSAWPETDRQRTFVEELHGTRPVESRSAKLWLRYMEAKRQQDAAIKQKNALPGELIRKGIEEREAQRAKDQQALAERARQAHLNRPPLSDYERLLEQDRERDSFI